MMMEIELENLVVSKQNPNFGSPELLNIEYI